MVKEGEEKNELGVKGTKREAEEGRKPRKKVGIYKEGKNRREKEKDG